MRFQVFDMVSGRNVGHVRANGLKRAREIARALYGVHVDVCEAR